MVEIPVALFLTATIVTIVVGGALAVLIYFLIQIAQVVLSIVRFVEELGRKVGAQFSQLERMIRLALAVFRD